MKPATLFILLISAFPISGYSQNTTANEGGEPQSYHWEQRTIRVSYGTGYSKEARETPSRGEYIYTVGPDSVGATAIMCFGGIPQAVVATTNDPIRPSLMEALKKTKGRYIHPTVKINDDEISESRWTYRPKAKLAIPHDANVTRKIYNAAIRGDTVSIDISGKGSFSLILPKPNVNFADFGAECGMGRNRKE